MGRCLSAKHSIYKKKNSIEEWKIEPYQIQMAIELLKSKVIIIRLTWSY